VSNSGDQKLVGAISLVWFDISKSELEVYEETAAALTNAARDIAANIEVGLVL